jgi:two-component system, OmpR family, response regulator QseB
MRILVVEDDEVLLDGLRAGLTLEGFTPDCVDNVEDAKAAMGSFPYDAVVLDVALPDGSGLSLLREWREAAVATPILLLTARNATKDRVEGLDLGADDYLGKPFDLHELAARLRAISRRAKGSADATLNWAGIVLDPARRTVEQDRNVIPLSRREFAVMHALLERPEHVLSRGQIEERLYGWGEEIESNAIEVHIHNLRAKLGKAAIETVRGQGYRMGNP